MMPVLPQRPPAWLRLPRRTARLRLTALYGGVFGVCGAAVLGLTYLLDGYAAHQASAITRLPLGAFASGAFGTAAQQASAIPADGDKGQAQAAAVRAALAQIAFDRQHLLITSGLALVAVAIGAIAVGWLIAGRVLRPLTTITAAARRISASSLHERLALRGPDDELKELADTLDHLFARLEASFDAQRRFAANASHELRTPLTRERALLEVTRADPAATTGTWLDVSRDLLAFNAEQERLIEALLTLASSEAGPGQRESADLAAITSAALTAARPAVTRLSLNVHADIQPAALDGDPLLVQQLVTNLVDNAVRHNLPGGDVQVATSTGRAGAVLSVASSGQFIPAAEVDRLFQPFQRLGPRRARRDGGHGLGLSIVKAIATAHDATITARARPGGGLAVDIAFPPPVPVSVPQTRRPGARRGALGSPGVTELDGPGEGPARGPGRSPPAGLAGSPCLPR
jgi:signal transduction histidine kinase